MAKTTQALRLALALLALIGFVLAMQVAVSGTFLERDVVVVWVFDVGQGDAIFIDGPEAQVLVDGGPNAKVLEKLTAVMPFWDREIDVLVNSHPHQDHIAGLNYVLERYRVNEVWTSGQSYPTDAFAYFDKQAQLYERVVRAGDAMDLGNGAQLRVVWPEQNAQELAIAHPHDANVTLLLEYGETTVLLTGDLEAEEEKRLLPLVDHVDVLKVGHHGSLTSTSPVLLEDITPNIAVIPVGEGNRYGHPHPVILDRLHQAGVQIFRTDLNGDVRIWSNGGEPQLQLFQL